MSTSNPWIQHVKKYAKDNNIPYNQALFEAKNSYIEKSYSIKKNKNLKKRKKRKIKNNEQQGGGILGDLYESAKNKVASLLTARPLAIKNLLQQYGNLDIQKVDVCRQPIIGVIKSALNVATGGDLSKVVKEKGYDNVFHLYCIITLSNGVRIRLDKNQRVSIEVNPKPLNKEAVCKSTVLPQKETLESFINKGEKLGNQIGSFYRYSAWDNNCQKFIKALLNASGNSSLDSFIMQDAGEFLKPGLLRKVTGVVTDTAALADYALKGGKKRGRPRKQQQQGGIIGRGKKKQSGCGKGCGDCGFCND